MPQSAPRPARVNLRRVFLVLFLVVCAAVTAGFLAIIETKDLVFTAAQQPPPALVPTDEASLPPFPVSVDPRAQTISESAGIESYLSNFLAYESVRPVRQNWWDKLTRTLASRDWYQNLASPMSRILVIWPGNRQEEVVAHIGDILRWSDAERATFVAIIQANPPTLPDGTFFPGRYVTSKDATPEMVAGIITERFTAEVLARYPKETESIVPLKDALTIASLLEREAYEFEQMREISGVIWNRLFAGMPLQLDATLQYVKADGTNSTWWPAPRPADKFLESPYNTYENAGLPPAPIANPSAAAILAALNPNVTDCMFYFHDSRGRMYCSTTYEEHVAKLKARYGQGR